MARKLRIEVEAGLYHVITRGNDRQDIFHSHEDRHKFLSPGAALSDLSCIIDLDTSTMSRRNDTAREKLEFDSKIAFAKERVTSEYRARIAELQD